MPYISLHHFTSLGPPVRVEFLLQKAIRSMSTFYLHLYINPSKETQGLLQAQNQNTTTTVIWICQGHIQQQKMQFSSVHSFAFMIHLWFMIMCFRSFPLSATAARADPNTVNSIPRPVLPVDSSWACQWFEATALGCSQSGVSEPEALTWKDQGFASKGRLL